VCGHRNHEIVAYVAPLDKGWCGEGTTYDREDEATVTREGERQMVSTVREWTG
jgi:hypothetical protein